MVDEVRREACYWRQLLTRIAEDLEHAAGLERDPRRRSWFASRAMRVRQRLHEGVPATFEEPRSSAAMTPRSDLAEGPTAADG